MKMKKVRLVVAITVISLLLPYTVIANSAKFDATKSWNNMVTVTYGVHDGSGNPDRNFTIKNEYGKVLSFTF